MINKIFNKILIKHASWLNSKKGGVKANLLGLNLRGADLSCANLRGLNLSCANLKDADLIGAKVS